ncbi:hypothetical protein [Catenulispora pinisilvae]|uniref:hypothetical protein n=1 Tax=Catenulispora pinisilvae TaxID=2705253 RepID=UPI0018915916|nr:hypothetical protein [Catenulispora pinisilvae]
MSAQIDGSAQIGDSAQTGDPAQTGDSAQTGDPALTGQSVVRLHELVFRPEGAGWIVGRAATGEFVELPDEAKTVLDVLIAGGTIGAAKSAADARHGTDLDVLEFTEALVELGFVAGVDDRTVREQDQRPPSLPFLRPGHVRFVFTRPVAAVVAVFVVFGLVIGVRHDALPTYRAFFALPEPGLNDLIGLALVAAAVAMHEFWHLAAARAAGVNAWLGWSTRLVFLVAQTTVPGLWGADRRIRLRVFFAGLVSDAVVVSACLLTAAYTGGNGLVHRLAELLCLSVLFSIFAQCYVFMRTDLYLVVQEMTRCKNLYADALEHLRWLGRRWRERTRGGTAAGPDPVDALPVPERRSVRVYSAFMALGTAAALAVFGCYQLPIVISTIVRAVVEIDHAIRADAPARVLDGVVALSVVAGMQAFTIRTLLRRRVSRR